MPTPTGGALRVEGPLRVVDGSVGGGQILRTSLSLSTVTGEPVCVENIRASRPRPGLQLQHLTAVRAAATVASADLEGDAIGSTAITFRPRAIVPGAHEFVIDSAGSAGLVLQTVLPALLTADAPSHLVLRGGTHNAWAPPWDFLARTFLPLVSRMGPAVRTDIQRHGFYPRGGGRFTVDVDPAPRLLRLDLDTRGALRACRGRVLVAGVPDRVADTQRAAFVEATGWDDVVTERLPKRSGPGNVVIAEIESEHVTEVFTSFSMRRTPPEQTAREAADEALRYLATDAPVGPHLADQLLLPLALGAGGSFRTLAPVDAHTTSNAALLRDWLGVRIAIEDESATVARVTVAN